MALFSPRFNEKSVSEKSETDFYIYLKASVKRRFSYSYRTYLRRNTHSHCAAVKNYYSVADTEIAVTACVHGNFLIRFAVTDKKLSVSCFQNNCAHRHHSYHLLMFDSYEYIMLRSIFSEYQIFTMLQMYSGAVRVKIRQPNKIAAPVHSICPCLR